MYPAAKPLRVINGAVHRALVKPSNQKKSRPSPILHHRHHQLAADHQLSQCYKFTLEYESSRGSGGNR